MKKALSFLLLAVVVIAAVVAVYRFCFRKTVTDAPAVEQVSQILQQNDCFVCHSQNPKLPFYAKLPVMGPVMSKHVQHAVNFVDLESALQNPAEASEVALSMVEHSVITGSMPISQYKMIHWGAGFNGKEKAVLAEWIRNTRLEKYSNGLACAEFAAEGIQPVPASIPTDPAKVSLGERMYNDTRLSHDGTISCASCHILKDGGADESDSRTSEGIYGQFGGVNAPTVYNAYFNVQQFWNGRAADLQEQAAGPPTNPVEMGCADWNEIVQRLRADRALAAEFAAVYPGEGITQATVTDAIAEYEKTLLTPDSRFDLYLKGDKYALSDQEIAGYKAFKENACATCHTGVILGGKSFERLGIFEDYFAERDSDIAYNADDDGLMGFTLKGSDLHKFKVPGLRNVALTAPYFHDGSVDSLEDAVEDMAEFELGKDLRDSDVDAIVAFMKTLTGRNPNLK